MKNEDLSLNRFKNESGDFKSIQEMNKNEKIAFILAKALKETIETLELSIQNDRIFNRTKYNVMAIFHRVLDQLEKL